MVIAVLDFLGILFALLIAHGCADMVGDRDGIVAEGVNSLDNLPGITVSGSADLGEHSIKFCGHLNIKPLVFLL